MPWDSRTGGGSAGRSPSAFEKILLDYTDAHGGAPFTVLTPSGGNDTSAFNAALTALAATGGFIYLSGTGFNVTSVSTPAAPKDITIVGGGMDVTTVKEFTANIGTSIVSMFDIAAKGTLRMRGLTLDGNTTATTGLMRLIHSPGDGAGGLGGVIDLERVRLTNYSYGVWEEDEAVFARDCIFDGGLAGAGIGTAATGIQHSFTGIGKLNLDNCQFTGNGVSTSNQHHNIYCANSVRVTANATYFEKLYGTGFQAQHNGGGISGIESKYTNCYFGPGASTNASQGLATAAGMILTLVNCTVEAADTAIYAQQNSKINLIACHFNGAASTCTFAYSDTGIDFYASDCVFNTTVTGGYHFYVFSGTGKLTAKNCRFTGAVAYDLNVSAALTGGTFLMDGCEHTGAVAGVMRYGSGLKATMRHAVITGAYSDAVIRNISGSTLAVLNAMQSDFSQTSGPSATLTTAPGTLSKNNNYGTVGYP